MIFLDTMHMALFSIVAIYLGFKECMHFSCHADVDECTDGSQPCDTNAACTNNDGGFTCECNTGFTGNGLATGGTGCTAGNNFSG